MWWATRELAEQLHPPLIIYASSSYNAFNTAGPANVVLTQDWLDLSVEHLSAYIKMMPQTVETNKIYTTILKQYIDRVMASPQFPATDDVINSTLAMLPIYVSEKHWNDTEQESSSSSFDVFSLAATVASLWRLGIPRVVIAGNTEHESNMVKQMRALLGKAVMEISYVQYPVELNKNGLILGPVLAVRLMRLALTGGLRHDGTEQQKWLGDNATRWKYIYFLEPDLPLHTRPQALTALGKQMKLHNKVLAAHRLQPIAHAVDFSSEEFAQDVVPNDEDSKLGEMQDLTFADGCCDWGNFWPGAEGLQSPQFWYEIGFRPYDTRRKLKKLNDSVAFKKRNERLMAYPMIRLKEGLRVPVVSQHARVCLPISGGYCGKLPQLHSSR